MDNRKHKGLIIVTITFHYVFSRPRTNDEKKSKVSGPGHVRASSRASLPSSTSRPQSRSSKPSVMKRQESVDLSLSPKKLESLQSQEEQNQGFKKTFICNAKLIMFCSLRRDQMIKIHGYTSQLGMEGTLEIQKLTGCLKQSQEKIG